MRLGTGRVSGLRGAGIFQLRGPFPEFREPEWDTFYSGST